MGGGEGEEGDRGEDAHPRHGGLLPPGRLLGLAVQDVGLLGLGDEPGSTVLKRFWSGLAGSWSKVKSNLNRLKNRKMVLKTF